MNTVTVSTFRRPFHTRLCLESLARAQRWSGGWANKIAVCLPCNWHEHPDVRNEVNGVITRNQDIPFEIWEETCDSNPHAASKWMLDRAFAEGSDINLYVEDDVVFAPDALLMCDYTYRFARYSGHDKDNPSIIGCCLYHETIPEQYVRENRSPDPRLLHLGNGINTCGGTAFLRAPYLSIFSPAWNCKEVEPRGFDYSAHFLMYLHKLYIVWPDLSRSANIGFGAGSISQPTWAQYFGRSIWTRTNDSAHDWHDFKLDPAGFPPVVREDWMIPELQSTGLL